MATLSDWPEEKRMTDVNWNQVSVLISLGAIFLYLTNEISTRECTLADTVRHIKTVYTHLHKAERELFLARPPSSHPQWLRDLESIVADAKAKVKKYIGYMQADFETYAICLLLDPPSDGTSDARFRGNSPLWDHLSDQSGQLRAEWVENEAKDCFLRVYTRDYCGLQEGSTSPLPSFQQTPTELIDSMIINSSPVKVCSFYVYILCIHCLLYLGQY